MRVRVPLSPARIASRPVAAGLMAVVAAGGGGALAVAGARAAEAASPASSCPDVTVLAVRGTGEPAGSGKTLGSAAYAAGGVGSLSPAASIVSGSPRAAGLRIQVLGVAYPASLRPTYASSVSAGRKALVSAAGARVKDCPASRIVLAGYSQGAHVIGDVLEVGSTTPLSAAASSRVAAVVLYGDPTFRAGEPFDVTTGTGQGWWPRRAGGLEGFASRIRSYCLEGDLFCQSNLLGDASARIHGSYGTSAPIALAASGFILDQLVGAVAPTPDPTPAG